MSVLVEITNDDHPAESIELNITDAEIIKISPTPQATINIYEGGFFQYPSSNSPTTQASAVFHNLNFPGLGLTVESALANHENRLETVETDVDYLAIVNQNLI
jgi:hypothetical protein